MFNGDKYFQKLEAIKSRISVCAWGGEECKTEITGTFYSKELRTIAASIHQ